MVDRMNSQSRIVSGPCRVPGRALVATASRDGRIAVWDGDTGDRIWTADGGLEVRSLAFTEVDGLPVMVSTGGDGFLRTWHSLTGEPGPEMALTSSATHVATVVDSSEAHVGVSLSSRQVVIFRLGARDNG